MEKSESLPENSKSPFNIETIIFGQLIIRNDVYFLAFLDQNSNLIYFISSKQNKVSANLDAITRITKLKKMDELNFVSSYS